MDAECADLVGGSNEIYFTTLAGYLSSKVEGKGLGDVENILHDEFTAVQELASWEELLVAEGLWSPEDIAGQQTEALCAANESSSNRSSIRRFGAARVQGVPILDPPH